MRKLTQFLTYGALVATFALPAYALDRAAAASHAAPLFSAQQQQGDEKADLYKKFTDNRKTNQQVAYDAAKEYLQKYGADNDQYVQYLQKWVAAYEKGSRKAQLPQLVYNQKNYAEAFALGKQVLADEPDNLRTMINLASAGYLASNTGDTSFNAETLAYARRATTMLEAGAKPSDWKPFNGQTD
ncbi:MAG: hypothetical protein ICV68_12580, partial [Pyrinomonadaceae bacterium]|nr:hypothetical protein [Pyrinomonadaceae bacterium]